MLDSVITMDRRFEKKLSNDRLDSFKKKKVLGSPVAAAIARM